MSFTWRDIVRTPVSKLDDDAFTKRRLGEADCAGAGIQSDDMVDQFRAALSQEADHLAFLRRCLTDEINRKAGII